MSITCLSSVESFALYFETSGRQQCNWSVFRDRLDVELKRETPNCPHDATTELLALLGLDAEPDAVDYINSKCQLVYDNQPQMDWEAVTKKQAYGQPLFDQTYYDGGSYLNEYYETNVDNRVPYVVNKAANVLKKDGSRIDDVYEAYAKEGKIGYADEVVDNFQNCPLRAAMCCFASDRQAGDNNGNCAKPYDENCVNADPADNTDLCYVDMKRHARASGTDGGFALYPGDNADGEGSIHCHGLAWGDDDYDIESRYKGNNIFYVSMYDHLYTRGYARNVPGAPMCGCLDKMPVVSRSDCTQVDVTELWVATFTPSNGTSSSSFDLKLDEENGVSIAFNACRGARRNNDLESYYHRLFNEGRATGEELAEVRRNLVGNRNCEQSIDNFVVTQGFEKL